MKCNPSSWNISPLLLVLVLVLLLLKLQGSNGGSPVKYLPGFSGPLPFELETGYVGVDEREEVQLFYYFVKSTGPNPERDPLLLWLTGGLGCSALCGLIYEIGPISFEEVYDGDLPKLTLKTYPWTEVVNVLFVDLPVGAGFSDAKTREASHSTGLQSCDQAYQFVRKWLADHPEYISNPFYVGGDSYIGITAPVIVQMISDGNELGIKPHVKLKGYLIGNGLTFPEEDNYKIPFAHGMGLISHELHKSLKRNCRGKYIKGDPSNTLCLQDVETFNQTKIHTLAPIWANDPGVQEALHVRKGTIGIWSRCNNSLPYTDYLWDATPYHANLSTKGYRSLIYNGDHDMLVTFLSTQAWIKSLNYSIIDEWRQWLVEGQIAGYTRTYANNMTFATIKGAGHITPEYLPKQTAVMFIRWISNRPL